MPPRCNPGVPPLTDQPTFAYNAAGDETSMTEYDHTGQAPAATTTMTYDVLHRLFTYTDPRLVVTTYTYDLVGNLIEADGPDPYAGPPDATRAGGCGCGVKCMGYDSRHEMTWETDSMNHTTSFGYDAHGNKTSVTDANQNTWSRVPDARNRPKTVKQPTVMYGGQPQTPTTSYSYDLAGNLIAVTDPDGNTTSYHYDNANRITSASDPNSAYTYGYDAADRLISDSKAATPSMPAVVLAGVYKLFWVLIATSCNTMTYGNDLYDPPRLCLS